MGIRALRLCREEQLRTLRPRATGDEMRLVAGMTVEKPFVGGAHLPATRIESLAAPAFAFGATI